MQRENDRCVPGDTKRVLDKTLDESRALVRSKDQIERGKRRRKKEGRKKERKKERKKRISGAVSRLV